MFRNSDLPIGNAIEANRNQSVSNKYICTIGIELHVNCYSFTINGRHILLLNTREYTQIDSNTFAIVNTKTDTHQRV